MGGFLWMRDFCWFFVFFPLVDRAMELHGLLRIIWKVEA